VRELRQKDFVDVTLLGNYPYDENESMIRYAEMLRKLLSAEGIQVEIIRPEPFFGRLKRSSHGLGKWLGYIDKYILFPISLRRYVQRRKSAEGKATDEFLVHICDHSNAIYTRWLQDVPHVVTCHDVMAIMSARGLIPGQTTGGTGRILQSWILSGLRGANHIVCVTPESRNDLLRLAPELENRSEVIENPLNYPYAPMSETEAVAQLEQEFSGAFRAGKDRFLLHVGGNQWYKNREGVIRIYARFCETYPEFIRILPVKLVMVGKPPTEAMLRLVSEKGLNEGVIFLTSVSDQQLCAFYSLAKLLLYPSIKEGFGWPIVEAQACGCPVVTSDLPPMNRLAGSTALLASPESESTFVPPIFQMLNESTVQRMVRKEEALRHSQKFEPNMFLDQILKMYGATVKKK